jgi:hypothetical protein
MIRIPPSAIPNADGKVAATYERIAEMFAPDPVPASFQVYATVPTF